MEILKTSRSTGAEYMENLVNGEYTFVFPDTDAYLGHAFQINFEIDSNGNITHDTAVFE